MLKYFCNTATYIKTIVYVYKNSQGLAFLEN